MSDPTPEEIRASIVANSDQLNADDLIAGPATVTITAVRKGDREQPIHIELQEFPDKSFRPCKTVRRILIAVYGDEPGPWVGHKLTLYRDAEVVYGGIKVGGVRLSHMTGISEPQNFMLTKARGKKAGVKVHPITDAMSDDDKAFIAAMKVDIANANAETLKELGTMLTQSPKAIRDAVRGDYAKRQKELKDSSPAGT
jgi:hypothetical protein